ncbi:hypothetical protein FRC03_004453 [Tulasnella sp. 419]|nr:hypothetical protein FRC03_004453 [Tulasnella sp. 419]
MSSSLYYCHYEVPRAPRLVPIQLDSIATTSYGHSWKTSEGSHSSRHVNDEPLPSTSTSQQVLRPCCNEVAADVHSGTPNKGRNSAPKRISSVSQDSPSMMSEDLYLSVYDADQKKWRVTSDVFLELPQTPHSNSLCNICLSDIPAYTYRLHSLDEKAFYHVNCYEARFDLEFGFGRLYPSLQWLDEEARELFVAWKNQRRMAGLAGASGPDAGHSSPNMPSHQIIGLDIGGDIYSRTGEKRNPWTTERETGENPFQLSTKRVRLEQSRRLRHQRNMTWDHAVHAQMNVQQREHYSSFNPPKLRKMSTPDPMASILEAENLPTSLSEALQRLEYMRQGVAEMASLR